MLFTKFCSSHPFEQYLECTETAMAFDALTVEADDDLFFQTIRRLAASSR